MFAVRRHAVDIPLTVNGHAPEWEYTGRSVVRKIGDRRNRKARRIDLEDGTHALGPALAGGADDHSAVVGEAARGVPARGEIRAEWNGLEQSARRDGHFEERAVRGAAALCECAEDVVVHHEHMANAIAPAGRSWMSVIGPPPAGTENTVPLL